MGVTDVLAVFDLLGLGVFAASGALAAAEKRLDVLGFLLFGTITGVGGGTVRDLLLDVPAFWISDVRSLSVCLTLSALTWYLAPALNSRPRLLLWADAMGLALFCVLGCAKAHAVGAPALVAVVMGVMSATFGGLIRDTLLGRESVLFGPELYVTAALAGAVGCSLLLNVLPDDGEIALVAGMLPAFILRAGAIRFGWCLPRYHRLVGD